MFELCCGEGMTVGENLGICYLFVKIDILQFVGLELVASAL